MRIEAVEHGGALAGHEAQGGARLELFHEHLPGTGDHGHQRPFIESKGVEQGQIHEDHVRRPHGHAIGLVCDVPEDVMVVHHPFRKTRGA